MNDKQTIYIRHFDWEIERGAESDVAYPVCRPEKRQGVIIDGTPFGYLEFAGGCRLVHLPTGTKYHKKYLRTGNARVAAQKCGDKIASAITRKKKRAYNQLFEIAVRDLAPDYFERFTPSRPKRWYEDM